jgi:hypothetical protein
MKQRSIQAFAAYLFTGLQPALPPDLQESGLNLKFDFVVQYTTQNCLSILSLWFLSIELEDGNFELTRLSHVKAQMGKPELSHPLVVFITTTTFGVHLTPTCAVSGDATVSHSRKSNSGKKNMNNLSQSLGFFLYHRMI